MKLVKDQVEITVSNRTVVRVLLLVSATLLGFAAIERAQHALMLIFIAFFLALAFNAPVHALSEKLPGKFKGSRTFATALSFVLILSVLGVFLASVIPPIVKETTDFVDSAPGLVDDLRRSDSPVGRFVEKYNLQAQVDELSNEVASRLKSSAGSAFSTLGQVGSSLVSTITVLALTFMMLVEGPYWYGQLTRFIPKHRRKEYDETARKMYKVIRGYVNGQVLLAAIASVLILPMLLILHISNPFALMFVVFICGLIPMIGHTIGAIIVTLVALTESPLAALIILSYYIFYQQVENYAVQPRIQANTTDMSPLLVFIAVVIGVSFSGLLGGLVAIPIAGCLRVALLYWLERTDRLPAS